MVQDIQLVRDGTSRSEQFGDSFHYARFREISFRIVVLADNKDTGMMPLRDQNQVMQVFEIVMIAREKSSIYADRVCEMNGIVLSDHANVDRKLHFMPGLPQQLC
jgi:hypothetical protein